MCICVQALKGSNYIVASLLKYDDYHLQNKVSAAYVCLLHICVYNIGNK